MSADFTPEKEDLKILTPFKMQVLTNFPYIEADFDAITNYQLLCKIVEYLNGVIHNENEVTEEVNNLYTSYVSLQNYVNNYFDNLDLQDEVNAKIDDMVDKGTFGDIVNYYLEPFEISLNNTVTGIYNSMNSFHDAYALSKEPLIKKKILAHRGCDNLAPENSIPAFEYVAKVGGYYGCETDVRRTSDGVFIIMHDESVDRTTDGTGNVSDLLYSTIQNLHIDTGAYIEDYTSTQLIIPTLENYLYIMKKYGLVPIVEIKDNWNSTILSELIEVIRSTGLLYTTLFTSFTRDVCTNLKTLDNNLNVFLTTESYDSELETFAINNKLNLAINGTIITENIVKTFHANDLKVMRWNDYNDTTSADYLMTEDITRCLYKDETFENIYVSPWDMDQIKKYGTSFNGRILTLLRKGHVSESNDFPEYWQSSNNGMLVCYNVIPSNPDLLFNYNIPVGYDMNVYAFNTPNTTTPWAVGWITGTGENASNVNITYLRTGILILVFRKTDTSNVNYKDIEYLRKNAHVWFTKKS